MPTVTEVSHLGGWCSEILNFVTRKAVDLATTLPRQPRDHKKKQWIRMAFLGELSAKFSNLISYGLYPAFFSVNCIMSLIYRCNDIQFPAKTGVVCTSYHVVILIYYTNRGD